MIWDILSIGARWLIMSTTICSLVCVYSRKFGKMKAAEFACEWFQETIPTMQPGCLYILAYEMMTDREPWSLGVYILTALMVPIYRRDHEDHKDDRWKRRRKKVAAKIKALASGRLVVVPAGR